jgi:hypothetical protein
MSKTYTRIYSTALQTALGGATKAPPSIQGSVVIPNGDFAVVKVPVSAEGLLQHLAVQQTGGTNKAFNVDVLNSAQPYPVGNNANALITSPVCVVALCRIVGQQTHASADGLPLELFDADMGYGFNNVDGTIVNPQQFIYVVIYPTSSVDQTTWDVSITVRSSIGVQG